MRTWCSLARHPDSWDAISCAATLIHFGDLYPPIRAARTALRAGGWLVLTLFANVHDKDAYAAGTLDGYAQGGCFAHGADYVAAVARSCGFEVVSLQEAVQECHFGQPKVGLVVALRCTTADLG